MLGGNHPGQAGKVNMVLRAVAHQTHQDTSKLLPSAIHATGTSLPRPPGAVAVQTDTGTRPHRGLLTREGSASLARLIPVTLRSVAAVDRQKRTSHTTIHISPRSDSGTVMCQHHQGLTTSTVLQYNAGLHFMMGLTHFSASCTTQPCSVGSSPTAHSTHRGSA